MHKRENIINCNKNKSRTTNCNKMIITTQTSIKERQNIKIALNEIKNDKCSQTKSSMKVKLTKETKRLKAVKHENVNETTKKQELKREIKEIMKIKTLILERRGSFSL